MKKMLLLSAIAGMAISMTAAADPWKDESGHGKGRGHRGGDYKQEYWDGNCKVEQKWKGNGEYKEERKCKPAHYLQPVPVYPGGYAYPDVSVEPGIVIQGRAVIR